MAHDLTTLLSEEAILLSVEAGTRKAVLMAMAKHAGLQTDLDYRDIFEAVMERERLGSTGMGEGVAIPHARIHGLARPIGVLTRLAEPVDFDAIDERGCDLVFMLLAPEMSGGDHLRALARVSRAFRLAEVRDTVRRAGTARDIYLSLCPAVQGAAA